MRFKLLRGYFRADGALVQRGGPLIGSVLDLLLARFEVAAFGKEKFDFLRRYRPFENSILSHDQLGDIFAAFDVAAFPSCFMTLVGAEETRARRSVTVEVAIWQHGGFGSWAGMEATRW
jgi:hypothetical protein